MNSKIQELYQVKVKMNLEKNNFKVKEERN